MIDLTDVELHPVRIPMRIRFRGVGHRDAVLFRGPSGWGEFCPFPEYPPEVAARWLAAAWEAATGSWPVARRAEIPVNVTIPAVDPATARELVANSDCVTAKVKVAERGQDFDQDLARVVAVRDALGADGRIRIDANGAWTVDEAASAIRRLAEVGLEYVEQPCRTAAELAEVRHRVGVPIAADESVRLADDPLDVVRREAADILVLKVQPLGGVGPLLAVARAAGLPVVLSSALETSVGMAAGVAAAGALDELPYACGLATVSLLVGDVVDDPLVEAGGTVRLDRPVPRPELLDRWRPDAKVAAALVARLREAARWVVAA